MKNVTRVLVGMMAMLLAASIVGCAKAADSTDTSKPAVTETSTTSSAATPTVEVPDLAGMPLGDASKALGDAKLTSGAFTWVTTSTVEGGAVVSQDPAAGAKVDKWSAVTLTVKSADVK